ncbi:MAG: hypothetical protein AAGD35_16905 [Actinomycetota bacterium]
MALTPSDHGTSTASTAAPPVAAPSAQRCETSRFAVFAACPQCDGEMAPEHAHYRCTVCGWRDSCCD